VRRVLGFGLGTLEDKPFDIYVTIKAPRGQRQNISSAREAAEWLLYKWPSGIDAVKARGPQACLEVLEGQRKAAAARQAFREAAAEAGILIGDVNRVPQAGQGCEAQTVGRSRHSMMRIHLTDSSASP
jgi:hypothetical protein